jgi:hypothetical protein
MKNIELYTMKAEDTFLYVIISFWSKRNQQNTL